MVGKCDPSILFVRPGAIEEGDKERLARAGVIVVEVDDPHGVKLVRPHADIPGSKLMEIAAKAISKYGVASTREMFGVMICEALTGADDAR